MQVLLCDDHAVFAESLALVLTRAGMTVVGVAQDPDEAQRILERDEVDVCVLDLMYGSSAPVAPGPAARPAEPGILGRLPELRVAAPHTRFLLLTGYLSGDLSELARAAGFSGVLNKGCHTRDIVSAIEQAFEGEPVLVPVPDPARGRASAQLTEAQQLAKFLTRREREVLGYLVTGADTTTLAKTMGVSWTTARSHVQSVLGKLGAHSRLEAATSAVRNGVVSGETGKWLL
jgi:two-component system nitrate/nitrite response regulator NarL